MKPEWQLCALFEELEELWPSYNTSYIGQYKVRVSPELNLWEITKISTKHFSASN
jgi:hypothetical protein